MKLSKPILSLLSLFALLSLPSAPAIALEDMVSEAASHSLSSSAPVLPEATQTEAVEDKTIRFSPPVLVDRRRPGGRREGGASRGSCTVSEQQTPLTALMPLAKENADSSVEDQSVFSLTTDDRPTFWFYTPYELSETPLEFVIQDENNNTLYHNSLFLNSVGTTTHTGIVQVTLPDTIPALQPHMLYHWYFMAYCDATSPAFVEGWIERMPLNLSLSTAINAAMHRERAALYARNGFWQEAITILGELYKADTSDPVRFRDWQSLLTSVNLEHLAEQPIIECCVPAPTQQQALNQDVPN